MLLKDTAICIRVIDYSETSQIATFFARETGKISVIAKGSKRLRSSFDGPLDIFSCGIIVFSKPAGDKLATLTEFQQLTVFRRLPRSRFALNCTLFGAELLNDLTDEYDPHPELFDRFGEFLKNIDRIPDRETDRYDVLTFLILFQVALLKEAGLKPVLNGCVNCKRSFDRSWQDCFFSSSANGLICRDCEMSFPNRISLNITTATCLNNLETISTVSGKVLYDIEKALIYHFTEILNRPPKMGKYITC